MSGTHAQDQALADLLAALSRRGYRFVTPTPASHRRVLARDPQRRARDLRDVLGWSLPFDEDAADPEIVAVLRRAGALETGKDGLRAAVRVSSLEDRLFLHSAFPAEGDEAVFFGPDTYRFAAFLVAELSRRPGRGRMVEVGAGSGAGALVAAGQCDGGRPTLTDLNPQALRLARINAAHAGVEVETIRTSGLDGLDGPFDLVIANPPYIAGATGDLYSEGGDMHGARLSLDWARAAMARLAPGGRLLLYTGSAIVAGRDPFREALTKAAAEHGCVLDYREIDVDVFGEELSSDAYADVERIAAVGAVVRAP